MFTKILVFVGVLLGAGIFFLAWDGYWWLGSAIFTLSWLLMLVGVIPSMKVPSRGVWAFLACGALLVGAVTTVAMWQLQANNLLAQLNIAALGEWGYIGGRLRAAWVGLLLGVPIWLVFFLLVGYFSSIYVVGLHEEDVGFWSAYKSFLFLIFNVNLAWLLVEDGKIIELKKQGFVNKWLSRGKIIIKPGNAIVTEKGGTITGIKGPGVKLTVKDERIREVFDLKPQFALHSLKNVITADQIPLEIEFGVGYRLTPAADPDAASVIKEKNFGAYAVDWDTLRKAAFNGAGWTGFGANAPVGMLRDQIMAHTIDELFEVTPDPADPDNLIIRADRRRIKRIENAISETLKGFADANMGVTYTVIDIRQIGLPEDVVEAVHMRIKARAEAEAIQRIEGERNSARSELVTRILNSISTGTGRRIGDLELQLATVFAQISKRALTDDVLGHQYIDMLKTIASGDAMKIFNVTPTPSAVEAEHIPDLKSLPHNGRGSNGSQH